MNEKLTLELNVNSINVVLQCLAKAPYESVVELILDIKQQAESQVSQKQQTEVLS